MGVVWNVLQPLLLFSVYAFIFGVVFDSRYGTHPDESRFDYAIGLFLSLALAQLVLDTLVSAPGMIIQVPNFVKKVVFPLEVLPIAGLAPVAVRSLVSQALVLLFCVMIGRGIGVNWLYLPVITFGLVLIAAGLAWWLSALGVFFRDVAPTMQFVSTVLMFTSGLFYSASQIPGSFQFLKWNPILIAANMAREAVIWHIPPSPLDLLILGSSGVVILITGHVFFRSMKSAFADVL